MTNPEARCERSESREVLKVKAGSVLCRIVSYVGKGFLCEGLALLLVNCLFVWFISGCHRVLLLVLFGLHDDQRPNGLRKPRLQALVRPRPFVGPLPPGTS